jgi:fructose/tagatose bisphosphate aldolase
MAGYSTLQDLRAGLSAVGTITGNGKVAVTDKETLRGVFIDDLVWTAVFAADDALRDAARWLIRGFAMATGNVSSSIHDLYMAYGQGKTRSFTVPAINIRGLTYEVARTIFRASAKRKTGAVIFEIARSEIGYTEQRPDEYAVVILAAAVKEGWDAPVFVQGDHFQAKASKFKEDPKKEIDTIKELIAEAVDAGFYQIDVDSSTLVTLEPESLDEQQKLNYEVCAELTEYIRAREPKGVTVSVGGEIGEVGTKNSTVPELEAFMDGFQKTLPSGMAGISKISVQTGTSHGGVPLPDGTIADVSVDFDTLGELSRVGREKYGIGGAVQHGASTLPDEMFDKFPEIGTLEIHLATGFQNIMFDHEKLPSGVRERIYEHLHTAHAGEKKDGQTDEQFVYKTRKKGFGPFKKQWWSLSSDIRQAIMNDLEEKFGFLFDKLDAGDTAGYVAEFVKPVEVWTPVPDTLKS